MDKEEEARQGIVGVEQVDDGESVGEPLELSRDGSERAAAIDACDVRTSVEELI